MVQAESGFKQLLLLNISDLPLAVVEHQAGGGELGGPPLLPALEAVQAALAGPEQRPLQAVQALHERRRVLVVGVLGRVHGPPEAPDEGLHGGQCSDFTGMLTPFVTFDTHFNASGKTSKLHKVKVDLKNIGGNIRACRAAK